MPELDYQEDWDYELDDTRPDDDNSTRPTWYWKPKKVTSCRNAVEAALGAFYNELVAGEIFHALMAVAREVLKSPDNLALHNTMAQFLGQPLDRAAIKELSWMLAGNRARLAHGAHVPRNAGQIVEEWALARVVDSCMDVPFGRAGLPGFALRIFLYTGLSAGKKAYNKHGEGAAFGIARRMGLLKRDAEGIEPEDLVGMYLYVKLNREDQRQWGAAWSKIYSTGALGRYNTKLLQLREDPTFCPKQLKQTKGYVSCKECNLGYRGRDGCKYALWPHPVEETDEYHQPGAGHSSLSSSRGDEVVRSS